MRYFVRFQTLIIAPITTDTKKRKVWKKGEEKKKVLPRFSAVPLSLHLLTIKQNA